MEAQTGLILDFVLIHVSEATSSVAMEKVGCERLLDRLLEELSVEIALMATDRHNGIRGLLKRYTAEYGILHQFDVWHLVKSIIKRLVKLAKKAAFAGLAAWLPSNNNHLWWCADNCECNPEKLLEMWQSLLHHITNRHHWSYGQYFLECAHNPLTDEQVNNTAFLKAGAPDHAALSKVVLDKRLNNDIRQLSEFCHTGALESYHSKFAKYVPHRKHFSHALWPALNLLSSTVIVMQGLSKH